MNKKFFFKRIFTALLSVVLLAACTKNPEIDMIENSNSAKGNTSAKTSATPYLVFQSGFEPGSGNANYPRIIANPTGQGEDIQGNTLNLASSDWIYHLETKTPAKHKLFRMNYEQGTYTDRRAEIIANPVKNVNSNNSNTVLKYRLTNAVIPEGSIFKGRVAAEMFSQSLLPNASDADKAVPSNLAELYQKVKFYLPTDWDLLKTSNFPQNGDWLLLFEYRNHIPTTTGKDSRVSVYITRPNTTSGTPLYLTMTADQMGVNGAAPANIWKNPNYNFQLNAGRWYEVEIYLAQGRDGTTARNYLAIRNVNATNTGTWNKLVDRYERNVHQNNLIPQGWNAYSPMKLYCNTNALKPFKDAGKSMEIFWDDLEIHENRLPTPGAIIP